MRHIMQFILPDIDMLSFHKYHERLHGRDTPAQHLSFSHQSHPSISITVTLHLQY